MKDASGQALLSFAYDQASRVTSSRQGFYAGGFRADYTYDRDGKVTGIKYGKSSWGADKTVSYVRILT